MSAITRRAISGCRCSTAVTSRPTSPWSTASRAGGAMRPASRQARARSTIGPCMPSLTPTSRAVAAPGRKNISPAIPACSISRPSAAPSSRRICASPTNGPISTVPAGSMRWSASMKTTIGIFTTTTAARVTASCCSDRTAAATGIRRRRWSTRSSARPASPACKSASTRTARRNTTPCRPAVSAWPSSTVSISARRSPRASGSGSIFLPTSA